eukprot:CAMPEP_0114555778 /NCGR_PEP_ID=MMETSP0114-20121206/8934_1 /TAXON_ID=31324 /ORGANISM="Goniomonas sp, Strain m" /LENGTH=669 /DNA_ID=CAMNT_0001740933 /DNA_START=19 /DNA_END=2029 /DNA_ORIENTATION=-
MADTPEGAADVAELNRNLITLLLEDNSVRSVDLRDVNLGPCSSAEDIDNVAAALKDNKSLISFNLGHNTLGDQYVMALAQAASQNLILQHLDVSGNGLSARAAETVVRCFGNYSKASVRLNLSHNQLGPLGAQLLTVALLDVNSIFALNVAGNGFLNEGAACFAGAITTDTLAFLDLSLNDIGPEGITALSTPLSHSPNLAVLSLSQNQVGPTGATSLAKALETNTSLRVLHLEGTAIGVEGWAAIRPALASKACRVQSLNLGMNTGLFVHPHNPSHHNPLHAFKKKDQEFVFNPDLTSLNVARVICAQGETATLAKSLTSTQQHLVSLDLSSCILSPADAESLAILAEQTPLKVLSLSNCTSTGSSFPLLLHAIGQRGTLQSLDLSQNESVREHIGAVIIAATRCSSLTALNLSKNNLGDLIITPGNCLSQLLVAPTCSLLHLSLGAANIHEVSDIGVGLSRNTRLLSLDLKNNQLSASSFESFTLNLAANTVLTSLDLQSCHISDATAQDLLALLASPECCLSTVDLAGNKSVSAPVMRGINIALAWHRRVRDQTGTDPLIPENTMSRISASRSSVDRARASTDVLCNCGIGITNSRFRLPPGVGGLTHHRTCPAVPVAKVFDQSVGAAPSLCISPQISGRRVLTLAKMVEGAAIVSVGLGGESASA